MGSVANIANAIKAKESVVNLAIPQSEDARAKIGENMNLIILNIYYQYIYYQFNYLLKIIVILRDIRIL